MTAYEIPMTPKAQDFLIALAGTNYNLTFHWSPAANCWILDIADKDSNPLVGGIAVVTGVNLIGQYAYLGIQGALVAQTDYAPDAVPTLKNFGTDGHLYFVSA